MSMYEDYAADNCFELAHPHGVNDDEWRTKDGHVLKISEMSTKHIENCMKMIGNTSDFYYRFEAELERRNNGI